MTAGDKGDLTSHEPIHTVSGYCSWALPETSRLPFYEIWLNQAGGKPRPHRVLPSGEPSITVRRVRDSSGYLVRCELVVCCQYTTGFWHCPPPNEELIALRLRPEIALELGIDLREYKDQEPLTLPHKLRSQLDKVWARAAENQSAEKVTATLLGELSRVGESLNRDSVFAHAMRVLRETSGTVSMLELASFLGISTRSLQRWFVDRLGVAPKFYARTLRLTRAAIEADKSEQVAWADVAAATGFHDQAHLIREYQQLIGLTPEASHRERRGLSDFSNEILSA